jgi:cystathionine beta-lyase/cystathionine gamma-synthase
MKAKTRVIHHRAAEPAPGNRPLVSPIYQTVKFELETLAEVEQAWSGDSDAYHYSRAANPSVRELEVILAELQSQEACVVVSTGIAAVAATLITLLSQGDHVVICVETYGPTRGLLLKTMARFGVTTTLVSVDDHAGIERALATTPTRMLWFESPSNPALKIADIPFMVSVAKRYGALTVIDNTFAGLEAHGQFGIDLFVHSLTKSAAGHGDVMGGAVMGRAALVDKIRAQVNALGPTLDPHAAFLISRGLKTYHVRRDMLARNALMVAQYLQSDPRVARVRYPGLPSHPGYALAAKQMPDSGSVVTIDLTGTAEQSRVFADALQLFSTVASLASTESLIVPPQLMQPRELPKDLRGFSDIGPTTARLSIGLEDADDLIGDLSAALTCAFGA